MKKILMIYKRKDNEVLDEYIDEYKNYDKSKLKLFIKIDGTSCLIKDGKLYKRYDNKKNKEPEKDWIFCYKNDKHNIYWIPVTNNDKWHLEAFNNLLNKKDGTYELIGPKINGNKHNRKKHELIRHDSLEVPKVYQFEASNDINKSVWIAKMACIEAFHVDNIFSLANNIEGFVLWDIEKMEPMFKIRKRDLGVKWGGKINNERNDEKN